MWTSVKKEDVGRESKFLTLPASQRPSMSFSTQMRVSLVVVGVLNGVSRDCNCIKVSIIFQGSPPSLEIEQPTSGVLTSPNYPERYPNDLIQVEKIQVPEGNTIWLIFTDFECEDVDIVSITDGDGTQLNSDSGEAWRKQIFSNTNTVEIVFNADDSVNDKGFRL